MKKRLIAITLAIACMQTIVSADLMPPNSHWVDRCATIDNLSAYPSIAVIGVITGPWFQTPEKVIIKQDSCMSKGYKLNRFYLVWTTQEFLNSVGLENLAVPPQVIPRRVEKMAGAMPPVYLLSDSVSPDGWYEDNSSPLVSEELHFTLYGPQTEPKLYLARKVQKFNNGTAEKVTTFNPPQVSVRNDLAAAVRTGVRFVLTKTELMVLSNTTGEISVRVVNGAGRKVAGYSGACTKGIPLFVGTSRLPAGSYHIMLREGANAVTRHVVIVK